VASLLPAVCEGEGGIIGGLYMGCGIIPAGTGILGNSLLEKTIYHNTTIHFWYTLITVADTKNELLFFVSADLINRYKKYYFSYRLT
jgi:hypothetical protein